LTIIYSHINYTIRDTYVALYTLYFTMSRPELQFRPVR